MQAPTIHPAGGTSHRVGGPVLALKVLGLLCSGGPLALLLRFAVGEGVTEEGWGHLLQAAPLIVLLIVAWWRPLVGGALITIVGTGLAIIYGVTASSNSWWLATELIFFVPAIVGGVLLVAAGLIEASETEARRGG